MPIDVTTQDFDRLVLEASKQSPVLVDFWAPWCGPCRVVGPVLEQLEAEAGGRWTLVKINVEAEPELGARYYVSSIPAMHLFDGGQPAANMVGALPKPELLRWLEAVLPGEERELHRAGLEAQKNGDFEGAREKFQAALDAKPGMLEAREGLAGALVQLGELEEAERLIGQEDGPDAARLRFAIAAARGPIISEARKAAEAGGAPEHHALGVAEAAAGNYEAALTSFFEVVQRDRKYQDDAGRRAMLDVFEIVGPRSELAETWRRKLSDLLY